MMRLVHGSQGMDDVARRCATGSYRVTVTP